MPLVLTTRSQEKGGEVQGIGGFRSIPKTRALQLLTLGGDTELGVGTWSPGSTVWTPPGYAHQPHAVSTLRKVRSVS